MRTAAIIPALNEEGNLEQLVSQLLARDTITWVVVADNGSDDETAAAAERGGALVISEPRRGYGYACAAGTAAAARLGAETFVYIDGDFSSSPREIDRLLQPLQAGAADLVLGSRMLGQIEEGAMPYHQLLGNKLSSWLLSSLYKVKVSDLGPFRAIRAELMLSLQMQEMSFGWPTEMMVKSARQGARIVEVPVTWQARRSGRSKVGGTLRGSIFAAYHILRVTFRYALN